MKSSLSILFLGGLGEIGMNMMVIEYGNDALIVDCGVMFPQSSHFGMDLLIPDFSYVQKIKHKIRGLLLTHGHEDHIGAVPRLLQKINVPIYGSKFTLALVESKFKDQEDKPRLKLHRMHLNQKVKLGQFTVEFLPVSHSIVDGMGLAIQTPQGTIIHTADFKIDDDPYHGKRITLKKFEEYGKKGVLALLSDSTNVEKTGKSLSEEQIKKELHKLMKPAKGRIIFSVFATNIRRIEQILEIAQKLNRRVILSGRSIENNVPLAIRHGFITSKTASVLRDLDDIGDYRPEQLIVACTGSQAEFGSALWRMSLGEHRQVKINNSDTVILSSKFIPGNEKDISNMINDLCRHGAQVLYEKVARVHVSGHAYAGELKQMIKAVKPHFLIPVHGEYRHLVQHAQLGESMGIPPENIFVSENGNRIVFTKKRAQWGEGVAANPVFVDGTHTREIETSVLKDRRQMSETGMIVAILIRQRQSKRILSGPHLVTRGVVDKHQRGLLKRAELHVRTTLKRKMSRSSNLEEDLRLTTRRFFKKELGKKPVVIPFIIDL